MKQNGASRIGALLALAALLMLAGCGPRTGGDTNNSGTPAGKTGGNATPNPTLTPGQVTIWLDKSSYGVKEIITVNVANGLSSSIYSAPRYTNCSVVSLQWHNGATWVQWGRCLIEQTERFTQLKANSVTTLRLDPTTNMTRPGAVRAATTVWHPGMYRVVFSFNTVPDEGNPAGTVVTSETFTVQ